MTNVDIQKPAKLLRDSRTVRLSRLCLLSFAATVKNDAPLQAVEEQKHIADVRRGVLAASGVWLILRPRTFQVIIGLTLISYAVNLFIFSTGGLRVGSDPVLKSGVDLGRYADPLPQALVLTAIVISFATTALFLVVLLASRGLTGVDHVDGEDGTP